MRLITAATWGMILCVVARGAVAGDVPAPAGPSGPEQRLIGELGTSSSMAARRAAMGPAQRLASDYMMGLTFQSSLRRCAIAVSDAQRSAIDAKLNALRNAVGPPMAEALRTASMAQSAGPCSPTEKAETTGMISHFIDETPDAFAAGLQSR